MTTYLASDVDMNHEWAKLPRVERSISQWDQPVPAYGLSQWKIDSIVDVLRLGKLQQDWDSYGSSPPSLQVLDVAIDLVRSTPFDDLPRPHIVPISGGGVQLEWRISQREVEVVVLPDRSMEYLKIERGEPLDDGKIEASSQLPSLLAWLQAT